MADLYTNAARIIEKVLKKQGSPKSLVINNENVKNKKKLYALVCEALKYKSIIEVIMKDTNLLSCEKQLKYPMALVLLYDFLFGKGLQLGGKLKQIIYRNKTSLHAALARMKVKAKVVRNEDLLPQNVRDQGEIHIPRYARVNTLKISTDQVVNWFCSNGYKMDRYNKTTNFLAQVANESSKLLVIDHHIPDILVFPPETDLHDHPLYCEGKIILQDKASCFPAFVLSPLPGSCVIDACAAPGNKTSHLAAIMKNKGKIFAFDIDPKRIATMKKLLHRAGEQITVIKNEDFLKTNPEDPLYKNVQYILVDPSCSGSGMVNRMDYVMKDGDKMDIEENQRIKSLAQFQVAALSHALCFPKVEKIVYSTCSVHDKENEEVVKSVLGKFHETFKLTTALPNWPHRGHPLFPEAENCVRASPREGITNGFFLALFTRKDINEPKETDDKDDCEIETMNGNELRRQKSRKRKRNQCTSVTNVEKTRTRKELGIKEKETVVQKTEKATIKKRKKRKTKKARKGTNGSEKETQAFLSI